VTYTYLVEATGQVIEVEQRITEEAHTVLEFDGELVTVRRLISRAPGFQLKPGPSGGWTSQGYALPPSASWRAN
jgi:predicted nucleic acid-binding Zn ribbon protein